MEKFSGVVFDLDETLTNGLDPMTGETVDIHFVSWKQASKELDVEITEEVYQKQIRGKANYIIDDWFANEFDREGFKVSSVKEPIYINEAIPKYLAFLPEVEGSLNGLLEKQVPMGIVTNAPGPSFAKVYEYLKLHRWFPRELCICLQDALDLGYRAKPDPEGLLDMSDRLKVDLPELIFVGDTVSDMYTANSAGVCGVGVRGATDEVDLIEAGAYACISTFDELSSYLV